MNLMKSWPTQYQRITRPTAQQRP